MIAFAVGLVVLSQLIYAVVVAMGGFPEAPGIDAAEMGSAGAIGKLLFTTYAFHLEIIAVLLLAATIGAVLLAKKRFV